MKSEIDVSNFDKYEEEEPWNVPEKSKKDKKNRKVTKIKLSKIFENRRFSSLLGIFLK